MRPAAGNAVRQVPSAKPGRDLPMRHVVKDNRSQDTRRPAHTVPKERLGSK
jgi:hypothetical protein